MVALRLVTRRTCCLRFGQGLTTIVWEFVDMFSVQKLATLVALAGAVVYGSRLIGRLDSLRREAVRGQSSPDAGARRWVRGESLQHCGVCGAYVSRGAARSCVRAGCPANRAV